MFADDVTHQRLQHDVACWVVGVTEPVKTIGFRQYFHIVIIVIGDNVSVNLAGVFVLIERGLRNNRRPATE